MMDAVPDPPREEHELGMRLLAARPRPPAATRRRVSRVIDEGALDGARAGNALIVVSAVLGLLLIALAGLGVVGLGPVAP